MKTLVLIVSLCLSVQLAHAHNPGKASSKKNNRMGHAPNPGDIMVSLHGNVFNYNIESDVRDPEKEKLFYGYAKAAYHVVNGFYVGGVYHRLTDRVNEKNTFGVNLTYVYKIFHVGASYLFHSNHKYRTDAVNAEFEKGQGYLLDASMNFPLSRNFYIGIGLSYHALEYEEVDYEDVSLTDSSIDDTDDYFMPMIQFTYFFRTHGKRVHEMDGMSVGRGKGKRKSSLRKSKSNW